MGRQDRREVNGWTSSDLVANQARENTADNRLGSCNAAFGRYRRRRQNG
jgi:hypothetical protein